jgi:hypothetical protein
MLIAHAFIAICVCVVGVCVCLAAPQQQPKVGLLVVFAGEVWPPWTRPFLASVSASLAFDWLFVLPRDFGPPLIETPPNVRLFQLDLRSLSVLLLSLGQDNNLTSISPDSLVDMQDLLIRDPYVLVEFKPCFGHLFQSILSSYEFWGYADMDMLMGRMDKLLPMDLLRRYDVVSVTFGDPYILYLRGQLAVHRNTPWVNGLWRLCPHLANVSERLAAMQRSKTGKWPFQSAEGCYSHAVLRLSNASVLLAQVQHSDAFNARSELREAFVLGKAVLQCHEQPVSSHLIFSKQVERFMREDVHQEEEAVRLTPVALQRYKCIYRNWFDKDYEVSLGGAVTANLMSGRVV